MSEIVYGVRLEGNSKSLVAETRSARDEFAALQKQAEAVNASSGKMASNYSGLNASFKQHNVEVKETASNVTKLLDRYDPLGAKLRQLQSDFKSLDAAAASGKIAGRDDARVDAVYSRLQREITATSEATATFGASSAKTMNNLGLSSQYARRELMQLGKEAVTGDFSRMPQTFGSLVTHSNLLPALISPIGVALAGVTAIAVAGSYAFNMWAQEAEDAAKRVKAAEDYAKSTKRMRPEEELEENRKKIQALRDQNKQFAEEDAIARDKARAFVGGKIKYEYGISASTAMAERASTAKANWDAIHNLERNNVDIEKQLDDSMRRDEEKAAGEKKKLHDQELKDYERYLKAVEELKNLHADAKLKQDQAESKDFDERLRKRAELRKVPNAAWEEADKIVDKARTTSAEYVNQLEFENSLLGKNAFEVQRLTERRRIDLSLEKDLLALRGNDKFKTRDTNPEVDASYQRAIKGAQDAAEAARQGADIELAARAEVNRSWEFGARVAMQKYQDEAANTAAMTEKAFSNSMKSMEDAEVKFIRTAKLDWSSLGDTIINELLHMQVAKINAGIMGAMSGWLSGPAMGPGSNYSWGPAGGMAGMTGTSPIMVPPGRASGGPVSANSLYRVNESGPEILNQDGKDYLMMGGRSGFVKPLTSGMNNQPSGGNTVSIMVNIDAATGNTQVQSNSADLSRLGNRMADVTRSVIVDEMRPGGLLAPVR